ncbi:MAG: ABC transporter permease, partial [Treponema sp.]|nr:ABC transporter permease [Treponema sp.]
GVGGSLAGVAVSALSVIPFNSLIAQKMALPFAIGGAWEILAYAVLAVAVCTASSVLAAVKGAVRVSRVDPYGDVK